MSEMREQIVREHLRRLEAQRFELEVVQTINGAGDLDPAPGLVTNGEVVTYERRFEEIDAAIARVRERYGDLIDSIERSAE